MPRYCASGPSRRRESATNVGVPSPAPTPWRRRQEVPERAGVLQGQYRRRSLTVKNRSRQDALRFVAVTGALPWTRALRVGGACISTDFQLQPYRVNTPVPSLLGSAVLRSTVDLFVNGIKQSPQAGPGRKLQLGALPPLNGNGQARLVITDLNGRP